MGLELDFEDASFARKNPQKSLEEAFKAGVRLAQKRMTKEKYNEEKGKIVLNYRGLPFNLFL